MAYTYGTGAYGAGLYSAAESATNTKISCWSFSIDGHPLVFVNLGIQGTYVLDVSTGLWSSWSYDNTVGLQVVDGQEFDEFYLTHPRTGAKIYTFDPNEIDDTNGEFFTSVTGGIPARRRETIPVYSVYAAVNRTAETDRVVSLFYSDDNGATWNLHGTVTPSTGTYELSWRGLGAIRSPGRIFELRDTGALASIDGLEMEGPA